MLWKAQLSLLLLLLSSFSRVRLCATPQTAAHQAPPSLGLSGQEHWSGLPFPSPMHESEKRKWSRSVVSNSSRPHGLQPTRLLCPWDFLGKSTGVGCHEGIMKAKVAVFREMGEGRVYGIMVYKLRNYLLVGANVTGQCTPNFLASFWKERMSETWMHHACASGEFLSALLFYFL